MSDLQFNLVSFNLRFWNPDDGEFAWPYRRESVVEVIHQHDPLVFGTQEGLLSMLTDLDDRLPLYHRVGEGRGGAPDEYCAIYYKKDILDLINTKQIWLSETPEQAGSKSWDSSLPRICTWAVFEHRTTGKQFAFFNTHLDHEGDQAREKGAHLIWHEMSRYIEQDLPCILVGDFNCLPKSNPIRFLRSKLVDALWSRGKGTRGTFHGFRGEATQGPIDYIFCSKDVAVYDGQVLDGKVLGVYPSDHFPILARVKL